MRLGQTSFVVYVSTIGGSVLGFVATLYFARELGAEVLGFYALALVVAKWLKLVGDVGVASAVTKRVSEAEERSAYFTAGLISLAILGLGATVLVLAFRTSINRYVGADAAIYVVLLLLVGLFGSLVTATLKGDRLVHVAGLLSPMRIGFRSVFQIALVFVGLGLSGMLLGYAAGGLLVGVMGLAFLSVGLTKPRLDHFRRLFDFAKYSWLGSLKSRSFNDVDVLVLGALVAPGLVGVYSIAWSITGFIGAFGSSIRQATFPEISRADVEARRERVSTIVSDSLEFNGLVAFPGLFGALVLADRLLLIYGREFTRGAVVLGLLILAMLVYDYKNQLLNALNAIDRPDLSFRVNAVFIAANLLLNVVLVLRMGWTGAAVATVIATVIGLVHAFVYLRRHVGFTVPVWEIVRQAMAAALMAGLVFAVRSAIEANDLASNSNFAVVLLLVIIGGVSYFTILLAISRRFRATVAANAPMALPFGS